MDCKISFKNQNRKRRRRRAPDMATSDEPAAAAAASNKQLPERPRSNRCSTRNLEEEEAPKHLWPLITQITSRSHVNQDQQALSAQQYDLSRYLAVNSHKVDHNQDHHHLERDPLVRVPVRRRQQQHVASLKLNSRSVPEPSSASHSSASMSLRIARASLLVALICSCCLSRHLITCQRQYLSSELPPTFPAANLQQPSVLDGANFNAEPRADLSNLKPNALDQLVGLLNNLANQQAAAGGQNRRPPLPINGPRLQQPPPPQLPQTSTPLSPFASGGANFQSNRRGTNFNPNGNNNPQQSNNQLFQPSSPATPFLTLNRIPNAAQNQRQPPQSNNFNIQPLNTIPLGSLNNQNRMQSNNRLAPPIRVSNQNNNNNNQVPQVSPFRPPQPPPPPVAPANVQSQQVKPSGGFAPSGPPPSQGFNNALVVVQSPSNASGQTSSSQVVAQPQEQNRNDQQAMRTTTTTTSSPETDRLPQPTDSSPTYSASPVSDSSSSSSATTTSTTTSASNDSDRSSEPVSASSWNPVEGNRTEPPTRTRVNLSPSPDIVTVPPGYNPDNPPAQNYDIAVSAQMGKPLSALPSSTDNLSSGSSGSSSSSSSSSTSKLTSAAPEVTSSPSSRPGEFSLVQVEPTQTLSAAPTAITTIIWSPPASELPPPTSTSQVQPSRSLETRNSAVPQTAVANAQPPSRIRDNSMLNDEPSPPVDPGVVYGKPQTRDSKPVALPPALPGPTPVQASIETSLAGRPFIQPVQMDNQVRPYSAGAPSGQSVLKSNHGQAPFRSSRPLGSNGQVPTQVGSAFTISGGSNNQTMPSGDIQDYLANQPPGIPGFQLADNLNHEPTISAQGAQDPATFDLDLAATSGKLPPQESSASGVALNNSATSESGSTQAPPRLRRPTFKPKPAIPPIRIDSCIVGDDSSCDQSHNERCVTEYGISSCHCKPGYARLSQLRGYCAPVSSLQLSLKIDKLSDDRRLVFNQSLDNSNSEEYQYLEFETIQALAGAFQQTGTLAKQFMGARVNKFFERKGKVWANVSVNFEANNMTKSDRIQTVAGQELARVVAQTRQQQPKTLGDSTIMLDGSKEAISRLVDVNECASRDLNDCSKHATCTNDFGTFHCQCMAGYEDKYLAEDRAKHGRVCLGCSPSYCSNRGECTISDGQKHCKCRPNFIGARCDIDSEVLAVAIGGSLVGIIILVITFWCLFVFNRRWKREQQKMDAMSATSGLTFNYVNSSTNSLMSPNSRALHVQGGLHRTGGHQVGAMAANYGQRFGAALVNGTRGANGQHYAPDQQAIIGSTSSGSSAASQPIGCNPYATGYQYEDAGLLIAPASTGSSEQTSPTSNSYRGILAGHNAAMMSQMAGTAYTLSGHHHHHHHHPQLHHHHQYPNNQSKSAQLSQFHPAAATTDYRTLNTSLHCASNSNNHYDQRWRTLQQESSSNKQQQSALVGYYLSPDMLINQQLYASPRRELCIDTGDNNVNKSRKQKGRALDGGFQSMRLRQQTQLNGPKGSMYHSNDYEHER